MPKPPKLAQSSIPGRLRVWFDLWYPAAMLAFLPSLANFLGNRYQAAIQDIFLPFLIAIGLAAVIALVYVRWYRAHPLAMQLATLMAVGVLGFNYEIRLSAIYPIFTAVLPVTGLGPIEGAVFSLIFIVLVFVGAFWLGRVLASLASRWHWPAREIVRGLALAIALAFLLEFFQFARIVAIEWPQFFYHPGPVTTLPASAANATKPDIYYIVLDRYASEDVLKSQFGYDNSDFLSYLKTNGYYVNPSAHNNYPYTASSIASTMSANYLGDIISKFSPSGEQTTIPFNEAIRQSPVAQTLQAIGYKYSLVGNWYETSNRSAVADTTYQQTGQLTILGHTFTLNNFPKYSLSDGILNRFLSPGLHIGGFTVFDYRNPSDTDMTQYALSSLEDLSEAPAGGRFIFAHLLIPHDPYYYNADGSLLADPGNNNNGENIKQKYLGQVQYINTQMKSILSSIQSHSNGQAVVVLQADEGPYPFQLNDENFDQDSVNTEIQSADMRSWNDADLQMKFGNLAAYHIPAGNLATDTEGADSVNVFRLIMNSYFDAKLPYLPDCYYAYSDGRDKPEVFADITQRLTSQAQAACGVDGYVRLDH